ncbi:hypothetical protein CEXT_292401 [Caerostris extrusa]|uniref:Uncharacterized protein n=1 Tax=Caerostris extrusa TaxID=172846 RepID=A0AAV4MXH7_CAEEX|nr:hypothetical protein CEXT_292401 [Caerostris extrusa]
MKREQFFLSGRFIYFLIIHFPQKVHLLCIRRYSSYSVVTGKDSNSVADPAAPASVFNMILHGLPVAFEPEACNRLTYAKNAFTEHQKRYDEEAELVRHVNIALD